MKFLAIFAILACLSAAAHAGIQPKSVLTGIIEAIIKNNRHKLANLTLDINLQEHGWLNGTLTGAENFEVVQLEAPGPLSLKISNASIELDVSGLDGVYEFIGVNIPDIDVTLNGEGNIGVVIQGVDATVALDCAIKGLTFQINDFHDFGASLQALNELVLEGIEQEVVDKVGNWIPSYIKDQLPAVVENNKAVILEKINEILAGLTY